MAPMTSWDALRVFVAVYRARSFSAAADELGLAQSSVSEQIARLERNLGHRLLERSPAGVRPTERGAELLARIAGPVDALAAATAPSGAEASRTVFLGGPAEFLSEVILPALLRSALPDGVRVAARFGQAEDLVDELRAGAVDVLVSALPVRGPDLAAEPVYDEEFLLVGAPAWADAADLDAIPVLSYGPELPIIRRYWRSVFGRRPEQLDVRLIAPDLRTLLRLASDGAGMTVLPDYLVREQLASGALVLLHQPELAPLNTIYVATRKPAALPDPAVLTVRASVVAAARSAR